MTGLAIAALAVPAIAEQPAPGRTMTTRQAAPAAQPAPAKPAAPAPAAPKPAPKAAPAGSEEDRRLIITAQRAIMKKLAFPKTARWRNLRVVRLYQDHRFDPPRVCGEVTAQTKTGESDRWRAFLYLDAHTIRIYRDPDTPGTDEGHNLLLEWSGCTDHEGNYTR